METVQTNLKSSKAGALYNFEIYHSFHPYERSNWPLLASLATFM